MRYIALLRAVNVGGRTLKMDRLRELFEAMKLRNVETFIASGNVIFETAASAASLEARIEKHLAQSLDFAVPTLVRSAPDFAALATHAPFAPRPSVAKAGALYVGFLKSSPTAESVTRVRALGGAGSEFELHGRELYWRVEDRRAVLQISITKFEKALGCTATFRNVTTVTRIAERYCL